MRSAIRAFAESIRGIVSDLDGVVYRGDSPIPEAIDAFAAWHRAGVPYAFVTNNASMSAARFAEKLNGMGVVTDERRVIDVVSATVGVIGRRWPRGTQIFAIGDDALLRALSVAGFVLVATEFAEVVVLGFDDDLTYAKLRTAIRATLAGAALVVTNPDVVHPTHDGFEPCVGATLAAILAAVPAAKPVIVGKPEARMIELALRVLGTDMAGTVMIGDQIATDVAAGARAGLRTVLVTTGVPQTIVSGVVPDITVSSLSELML